MALGTDRPQPAAALSGVGGRRRRAWPPPGDQLPTRSLPVVAAVLARPLWLLLGASLGLLLGALLAGNAGFNATSTLQLGNIGQDSARAKQVAQTAQRVVTSATVIEAAAAASRVSAGDLGSRVSARWEPDTDLVTVLVTDRSPKVAVAQANAVALATVNFNRANVQNRLSRLRKDVDRLLSDDRLTNDAAEAARRAQIGSALATRQDAVSADTDGVFVADPAQVATPAGLGWQSGGLAGLLAGVLLAALAAIVAGARRLRVGSRRELRALLPEVAVASPADAGQVAGSFVESGVPCLAVVSLPGSREQAATFATDVAQLVKGHGLTVTVLDVASLATREARFSALCHDARNNVPDVYGTETLIVVVESVDEAIGMLVGQSNLRAALVVRARQSQLRSLVQALSAFNRADPLVILAR